MNATAHHVIAKRVQVQGRSGAEIAHKRFKFRGERQPPILVKQIERLFAKAITHKPELGAPAVINCGGKHAIEFGEERGTPTGESDQKRFGVRMVREKDCPFGKEGFAQIEMIVNLTVKND